MDIRSLVSVLGGASILLASIASANPYAVGGSSGVSPNATATSCAALLGSNLYSCNVVGDGTPPFHDCFQATPGTGSEQVDISSAQGFGPLACNCYPTGSSKKPNFDASKKNFLCAGFTADEVPTAFVGKVSATKITKGVVETGLGGSIIVDCVIDPTCTP
jgi:hypothetical protein